jgi:dTDP-4-amino-4,6-dideoxygalactose transaminase
LQQCFATLGLTRGSLPVAEHLAETALSLPVYPELSADSQAWVVESIAAFYAGAAA